MQEVRRRATDDAIRDARRQMELDRDAYYAQQQESHLSPQEIQLNQMRAQLAAPFAARMNQIKPPDIEKLVKDAQQEGTDVSNPVMDALLALPGGAEATV